VLIYLLIVVNFQSWLDPFVIIMALPSALAGIVWMLFATDTTLSVPALTGAIMCMGVATANSILVISFARERLAAGADALSAALEAGSTRFRPVLMTAVAMIIGMAPMAIESGQNAPLGRAAACCLRPARPCSWCRQCLPSSAAVTVPRPRPRNLKLPEPEGEPMSSQPMKPPRRLLLSIAGLVALVAAGAVAANGLASRARRNQDLATWTKAQAIPTVALATIDSGPATQNLILPGNIQPYHKAAIYARVSGYLKSWQQDIGAHVAAGQVLAEIDTPDLDQQLAQARATLASTKASYDIAALTAQRYDVLAKKQAISQQIADQNYADATAKKAVVDANDASVRQLEAMQAFKQIVAPFDGIVTKRNTDVGALINAGNTAGQELFEISDLHRVRIYVQVPQAFSADVRAGMNATFALPQYPGQKFDATVVTTSNAMSAASRSMLVELQADNADAKLLANTYCKVAFEIPGSTDTVRLPATALIQGDHGAQVAVLGDGDKAVLKLMQLGRDFGDSVEVTSGLAPQDQVIDSPPETLQNGDRVRLAPTAKRADASR
jgi:RND family efflux transporter MFP subunit